MAFSKHDNGVRTESSDVVYSICVDAVFVVTATASVVIGQQITTDLTNRVDRLSTKNVSINA